jgi:hypothetical protein
MDVIKWGKTRAIENVICDNIDNSSNSTISFVDDLERITVIKTINIDDNGYVECVRETDV